ncbi:MAG: hypothetical protein JXQ81_13885 [Desulfuromonadales bacterium]|nr:hypothetical protein [Desulfuromonadales bacterium]MBN2793598.1 hypothetical protein [Desulfuromonadales bacterium]
MPRHKNQKSRLPYWNLLFIAVILSGGGFFWHTTYRQQQLDQLDSQLFLSAEHINSVSAFLASRGRANDNLCQTLDDLSITSSGRSHLGIYSAEGSLLCTPGTTAAEAEELFPAAIPKITAQQINIEARQKKYFRVLLSPLSTGQSSFIMALKIDMEKTRKQLNAMGTLIFLLGIVTLTCFSILQRRLRNQDLTSIRDLTRLIAHTTAETCPTEFSVSPEAGPEVQQLAASFNTLMSRICENLRRSRQFSADVTHELRTPLTILRGETELALRNGRDRDQLRQVLESNLEEISRMSYLIEDLLLLSKSDLGEIPLKKESLNLSEMISELSHQAQLLADAKQIAVTLQAPEDQVFIQADSLRLRQVLLNLVTNAIKYTPEGGHIEIILEHLGDKVDISINDSGIGITSEHLDRIFERFYRVNKTGNRNDGGSGLGLAIVKWIVDAHQGTVRVSSIPEQGSVFSVVLPLSESTEE